MEEKFLDAMIDVETLGNEGKFLVLEVSMVIFDIKSKEISDEITVKFDLLEQINLGFEANVDTLHWWISTDLGKMLDMMKGGHSLERGYNTLQTFIEEHEPKRFWATATLDYQAISNLCDAIKQLNLIPYNKRFCGRTVRMLAELEGYTHKSRNTHASLEDCQIQIEDLNEQLNHIHSELVLLTETIMYVGD